MSNFGLGYNNGFNNTNNNSSNEISFAEQLKKLLQPQQPAENAQRANEPQQINGYSGTKVYEIMKSDNLTYIKPDETGQKQIISCEPEKIMYVARYNYATREPDYEKYISEGTIELFKKNDTSAEMSQIALALGAVVNTLESMQKSFADKLGEMYEEIQDIKSIEPEIIEHKKEEPKRRNNGQFKKKGED